jgi:hypothetical protein
MARSNSPMGSQGPTRASCAGPPPSSSQTAPDPRASVGGRLLDLAGKLHWPSRGLQPCSLVGDGGNEGRGAAMTRSKPPVHLAPARLHWVAASFVTHHLPTSWKQVRVTRDRVAGALSWWWTDGRTAGPVRRRCVTACARAVATGAHVWEGRAPDHPILPRSNTWRSICRPPQGQHGHSMRAHGTNSALDWES